MIECIFTIDYEIYGNGEGSLRQLVFEPALKLVRLFQERGVRFVAFVEAAELDLIEQHHADEAITDVRNQVRELHNAGFEIALHLHPQWYNALHKNGDWILDYSEYNLCTLSRERIEYIIQRSVAYLRDVVGDPSFTPLSFRAGNWLFQPCNVPASVLANHGIKIDSSVFKGGLQRNHRLDYRPATANGYFWQFKNDVNQATQQGAMLEIPTYTRMVPFWKMLTSKRVGLQRRSASTPHRPLQKFNKLLDLLRPWYPLKFDFCRMTLQELICTIDCALREDARRPDTYKPIVAIGH